MSSNIKHEAVFPPAVFNLRRMSQPAPTKNSSKGSYELYDSQQKAVGSFGEKKVNGLAGTAPGSPGSMQDYKQIVANLQRELEESRRKGSELEQIIADLNSPPTQSSASLAESQLLDASSSNDSLGENVKDAHIRHLQRQVTILQANLYKCEGWASRVANCMKERDKAVDDVTRLTNEIKNLEGDNLEMHERIHTLTTSLQESQQNLRQISAELESQVHNGQLVSHLRDEVQKQKSEIATLKQSLTRLDSENKSLKDSGLDVSSQSVGNMACSQELEHLHLVVDKLKDTVLEQRSYLLQLKRPFSNRNVKSLPTSGTSMTIGGLQNQDFNSGRKLSSPTLRATGASSNGNEVSAANLSQQAGSTQCSQSSAMKAAAQKGDIGDAKKLLYRTASANEFGQELTVESKRKLSSRDTLDEVFHMEDLNSPRPLLAQGEGLETRPGTHIAGSAHTYENVHQKSADLFKQHGSGDMTEKSAGHVGVMSASEYVPMKSPNQRLSQSEVIATRNGLGKISQENWGSKSEVITRQSWLLNSSSNKSTATNGKPTSNDVDKFVQVSPGLALNYGHRYQSAISGQKEPENGSSRSAETARQFVYNGSTAQRMLDSSDVGYFENVNRNSPTFQPQFVYNTTASSGQQGSVSTINRDMMAGSKAPMPGPPAHCGGSHRPGKEVVYVNSSAGHGLSTKITSSSVDPDPSRARLNSDRLCPVCNNDYSHVDIEEFQTHVFECFDDENPPETMKPQICPYRLCPMCNARFGPDAAQAEFEKHVHSHFGEDCAGDRFEHLLS